MSSNLKKNYGFRLGSYKYIIPGGELMKYIGQTVVCVSFVKNVEKDENGEEVSKWTNNFQEATIVSLSDFDVMQLTWLCRYQLKGEEEVKEIRILPEGYSFEGDDPENTGRMIRFVPMSLHFMMLEDEMFFLRLAKHWEERRSLNLEELLTLSRSKGQEATLKYSHNIGALVKLSDEEYDPAKGESRFLWIRIHKLSCYHKNGNKFNVKFSDNERSWSFLIDPNEPVHNFEGGSLFKIIDLSDDNIKVEEIPNAE